MREQYVETLIKLIELNNDQTWLSSFLNLRTGGYLPSGGAGSLNDWGPSYNGLKEQVWYSQIYDLVKYLREQKLNPEELENYKQIKFRTNIRIIRCLNCNESYQHPSAFETYFALEFLNINFNSFMLNNKLVEILDPLLSFDSLETNQNRECLSKLYANNNLKIYDFVSANYACPHCSKHHAETAHDLYKIKKVKTHFTFTLLKQDATWTDFEQ